MTTNSKFSLKASFCLSVAGCLVIATGVRGFDADGQYGFRHSVEQTRQDSPVCSTLTPVRDLNDLVIHFDEKTLKLKPSADVALKKRAGAEESYDLECPMGKYRIIYYGDTYKELTSKISPDKRSFDVLRDSLMLDDRSRASNERLWKVRTRFMPVGCDTRLQHFETPNKYGFISGSLESRPETVVFLFDSSGEYSIGILPLEPKIDRWDSLVGRLVLKRRKSTGN